MNINLSILIVVFFFFFGKNAVAQSNTDTLKTTVVSVSGISCKGDMPIIKKKLINQEGIDEVDYTDLKKDKVTFTVKYHSIVTSASKIQDYIESAPSCDDPNTFPYKTILVYDKNKKQ